MNLDNSFLFLSWGKWFLFVPPCLLISVLVFFLVYFSVGYSHGQGRYPWRAAQPESVSHGRIPEESWILRHLPPLAAHFPIAHYFR